MSASDRSELDGYEALVAQLRANPPVAPERLRQRVLELAPAPRRRKSSRRRLGLVVVPVTVALAVGAAVVYGVFNSGSRPVAQNAKLRVDLRPSLPSSHKAVQSLGQSGVKATQGTPLYGSSSTSSDSVRIPKNRLVHADASLQVQVPNRSALSKATNEATQIVASLGGYAQSVRYQSSHQGYGNAVLSLRVPVQKAQSAIARLGSLGTLLSQQVSTQDLQQQLTRQTNGIGALRRSIAVYEQALKNPSLSASQRVEIQIRLANAQHSLKLLRKARAGTIASGATADISLLLTTRNHAVVAPHHPSGRFGRLLGSAAGFLALEGIIVLYALVVLSPVLVLGGLAWWLLRERRRREETRLLASA